VTRWSHSAAHIGSSTGGAAAQACVRAQDMRNAMELVRGAGLSAPMCA
jgi:hypothetical protein